MADLSAMETRATFEEQKRFIRKLQDQLADKEFQVVEGEKLRKKLHNTVLVMFGSFYFLDHLKLLVNCKTL
jgi:kinesin family member C1